MSLLLHCGAHAATRDALYELPEPESLGRRHQPTAHWKFLDIVEEELDRRALDISEEAFGLTKDGNRFFGLMTLTSKNDEYATLLGLRSSHDESMARGIALGSRVFVCDNLSMTGEHLVKTKNTTHVMKRLPGLISAAIAKLPGEIERQDKLFERFKHTVFDENVADAVLVESVRRDILPPSKLGKVIDVWDRENGAGADIEVLYGDDPTGWKLYNSFTEVLKPANNRGNVPALMDRTIALTGLLEDVVH